MPVRRFRSVEEMESPVWRNPGDPDLYRAVRLVWEFGRRSGRRRFPCGVHKHRSIADLNALTEHWSAVNVQQRADNP
jgi:hypothetical protein